MQSSQYINFFFGSTSPILDSIKFRIQQELPELPIAGTFAPPFREWTEAENKQYIDLINRSGAQLVLVSLGCPKQETWMAKNYQQVKGTLIGIGGVFAVYGRLRKRAPLWMQKMALEWLFRLLQEPKRMFKRYLVSNTLFIALILRQWFNLKIRRNR
jgi:N-acetylglucosaminyldiphosphoundecaprenol N-acetyl-beta-D-mannosaminyltransferase